MLWRDASASLWPGRALMRDLDQLQREVNRLMGGDLRAGMGSYPALNIWTDDDSLMVTAEMPGVSPEDLELTVDGETLTIQGSRTAPAEDEGVRYHRRERTHGRFSRTVNIPFRADAEKVEAHFRNGVLRIEVPRAEVDKPRTIQVKNS